MQAEYRSDCESSPHRCGDQGSAVPSVIAKRCAQCIKVRSAGVLVLLDHSYVAPAEVEEQVSVMIKREPPHTVGRPYVAKSEVLDPCALACLDECCLDRGSWAFRSGITLSVWPEENNPISMRQAC
jgi:hypothetical protein